MMIKLKNCLLVTLLLISAVTAVAQTDPVISIRFSPDKSPVGPATAVRIGEIATAYIVVDNADMMVAGASFKLSDPGNLFIFNEQFPDGLVIGDLFTGVEIGLIDPIPQFDSPAVIATFQFMALDLGIWEIFVENHPNYETPVIADPTGPIVEAWGDISTIFSILQPEIGIFFDAAGTTLDGTFVGGPGETVSAFLLIRDLDVPIINAFLSLELPPSVSLISATLPPGCTMTGDLIDGANLLYDPPLAAPGGSVGLMAELLLAPGNLYLDQAPLTVGGYPDYSNLPLVYTGFPQYFAGVPLISTISIPIANEDMAWGRVKTMFR